MSDWFALIDTAQDSRLYGLILQCRDRECLFAGNVDPALVVASPHIVRIDEQEPLLNIWRHHGAGKNWGILVESDLQLADLRRHFRKFMQVRMPDASTVMFRFYDPRVFKTYLTSAPPEQIEEWFDGVRQYAIEVEGKDHVFRLRGGHLFDGDTPIGEFE
ncbi:DUF4123 domain-containing protein [Sphingomonas immobilis]|uniref:DUF4123 domain-containing protein n=1 Tax=Sphingomonas immobilis TaxID=3063997 RepID=A0ABT9A323_9SPHN|nr:DUF4123 domain-containing protein [Sphingomonas sp. CA1-15]MDO7843812.1 DUF4123 domain-containing protein [Sphingomonas sp. CA1-15]